MHDNLPCELGFPYFSDEIDAVHAPHLIICDKNIELSGVHRDGGKSLLAIGKADDSMTLLAEKTGQ